MTEFCISTRDVMEQDGMIYIKMKKIIITIILGIFLINLVSAYDAQRQNTDYKLIVSSNNATYCNVTYIGTESGLALVMTKENQDFSFTIDSGNFTTLGDICMGITCSDGYYNEIGSKCLTISPSGKSDTNNLVFIIFIILIIYAIAFIGFFGRNEIVTLLGGMFMIGLGIYLVNNGIIVYRDWITNYFCYITIGIGSFFSLYTTIDMIQNNM